MSKPALTVNEYLDALPGVVKESMGKVRRAIKSAAPDAVESISYRVPFYRLNGHLAAIVAHKNHSSFVTMSHDVIKQFKDELKSYKTSGTTIHFPPDKALPSALVKNIIKVRIKENTEKLNNKQKKKAK